MDNKNDKFTLVGARSSEAIEHISKPALTFWQDAWRRLKKNKLAVAAMIVLILTILFALISIPFVSQKSANNFDGTKVKVYQNLPPKIGNLGIPGFNGQYTPPGNTTATDVYQEQGVPDNKTYALGTDKLGRSLAQRVIVGLRISLMIAFAAALIDLLIGVTYGMISGWIGGKTDTVMQRIIEIISSVPNLIVVTMLSLLLGQGIFAIIISIGLFSWTSMARQVRSMVLSYKERDFILASKTLGESSARIAIRHILPNISGVIIVQIMLDIPAMIMYEAILSAINLGIQPPASSLGSLINSGLSTISFYPWQLIIPALTLAILSLAFILFGDGLRDAFDPKSSEE